MLTFKVKIKAAMATSKLSKTSKKSYTKQINTCVFYIIIIIIILVEKTKQKQVL